MTLEGYITVGDSTDYANNAKCVDVVDIGFFHCTSTLRGRYITFISVTIEGSSYEGIGLGLMNFSAYSSTNLVVTSTLVQEPDLREWNGILYPHITPFSTLMAQTAPRSPVSAANLPPYTGTTYELDLTDTSKNKLTFKLASPTYV